MSNEAIIQADFEPLGKIARHCDECAQHVQKLYSTVDDQVMLLQNGEWQSPAASLFYSSMNQELMPGIERLMRAFQDSSSTLDEIVRLFSQADEEASQCLNVGEDSGAGGGGGGGTPSSGSATGGTGAPTTTAPPTGPDTSGQFHVGPPQAPNITHDGGFLDYCAGGASDPVCSPDASLSDHWNYTKWRTMLNGAELVKPSLEDGTDAYRHFLDGGGADRYFDYGEFIREDAAGQQAFDVIVADAQQNVEIIGQGRDSFSITSDPYYIGSSQDARFPYPDTENWQKAIGAHPVWTSADVNVETVNGQRVYTMEITFHAEDRYNFNPGQADIATGSKDAENGRFSVLGWADPYMQYGETTTTVTWVEGDHVNVEYGEFNSPHRDRDR